MKHILHVVLALSALSAGQRLWAQATGKTETIYSFQAPPGATYPAAGPIISKSGVIYGTTNSGGTTTGCGFFNCGTVYELTPTVPPSGALTETTLYSFTGFAGGAQPNNRLVFGASGTLYGWANGGAFGQGVVYELTPPASPGGAWTETEVYSFQGPPSDGGLPVGGLAIGKNGSLYGATYFGGKYDQGTVFELTPPASVGGVWTLTVLYSFHGDGDGIYPGAGVIVAANGVIYGTTTQGGALGVGTVFGLKLVAGAWKEEVLSSLTGGVSNPNGLAFGPDGVLYGQTPGDNIFEAMPPAAAGGAWTVQSLYNGFGLSGWGYIDQPSIAVGPAGAIYWTTTFGGTSTACGVSLGCGALNELVPPTSPGGSWTQLVLHNFTGQAGDGYQPNGGLVVTKNGDVIGTTYYGGQDFFGTVFRYTP
jgi:uncharacterized repeat protein (TIGR03803 family)